MYAICMSMPSPRQSLRTRNKLVEVFPCCRTQIFRYQHVHIIIGSFSPIHTLLPHCLLLLDPVLSQFNPHRILTSCSCKFHFNSMRYADQYCSELFMSAFMLHVSAMSSFYVRIFNHFSSISYCYAHFCFFSSVWSRYFHLRSDCCNSALRISFV
jgi:hypothetical protein